jgi:hypothetical protein
MCAVAWHACCFKKARREPGSRVENRRPGMATKRKAASSLKKVRVSVTRVGREGAQMVERLRDDARKLVARSRSQVLKDVRAVQKDLRQRADQAMRDLERRVVRQLHAATETQVRRLERRVAKLEQQMMQLARPSGEQAA